MKASKAMKIDHDAIRSLAELLNETGLNEIEISEGEYSIRINKGAAVSAAQFVSAAGAPAMAANNVTPLQAVGGGADAGYSNHPGLVKSPMVGTAYLQPEPGAPQYKNVGDTVSEGDTVLIVEAMKVMNQIKAPKAGKIKAILVTSGEPVEFDQPLYVLE